MTTKWTGKELYLFEIHIKSQPENVFRKLVYEERKEQYQYMPRYARRILYSLIGNKQARADSQSTRKLQPLILVSPGLNKQL